MKRSIIFLIIIGLVIFVSGAALGIFYETQKLQTQLQKEASLQSQLDKASEVIKALSSNMVTSMSVSGTVEKISGNNITLSYQGGTADITARNNIMIFGMQGTNKQLGINDIKVGNVLYIDTKVLQDGSLQGISITIFH